MLHKSSMRLCLIRAFFYLLSSLLLAAAATPLQQQTATEQQLIQHYQSICNDKHLAVPYHYNSIIGGFTNITKALHFTASFDLVCEKFDDSQNVAHFALVFSKIATKIKETASRKSKSRWSEKRRHKMPHGFAAGASNEKVLHETMTVETPSGSTSTSPVIQVVGSTEHDSTEADSKENIWYDMPNWPVKFVQHLNGTVFDIFIKKEDHERKSEISNLKKSIALLFQTNRDLSSDEILETDDLGLHYSEYAFHRSQPDNLLVIRKTVAPDDFIRLQHDSMNAEKIEIFVDQYQRIFPTSWKMQGAHGRVATYPIEATPNANQQSSGNQLPFKVEVTYSLTMDSSSKETFLKNSPLKGDGGFVRLPSANFTTQEYDNSELLGKILTNKIEKISKLPGGLPGLVMAVAENPLSAVKQANLLRGIIGLESKIYLLHGRTSKQPYLDQVFPIVAKRLREDVRKMEWDSVLKLVYILSSGVKYEINTIFMELLNETELMDSTYRPQFLNTLIQFEYPTDRLIEHMLNLLPDVDSMSITEHHISLAISSLIAKENSQVSDQIRIKVIEFFQGTIEALQTCPAIEDVYKIFLESIANFLTAERVSKLGEPANNLVSTLIAIVKNCRHMELSVEALNSLRNCLTLESVQVTIADTMRAADTPCEMRGGMVDALVIAMELSTTRGITRSWPRYGSVPSVDGFILTEFLEAPGTTHSFQCNKQPILRYLAKKKGREWNAYLLHYLKERVNGDEEDIVLPEIYGNRTLVRHRRDDMMAGNPLAGLAGGAGGLPGGLNGFVFTPEVDCDNWNSQVGVNYTEVYENPIEFDNDIKHFNAQKRHCLFRAEFKATLLSGGLKAGFFAGRNERGESKLFGRAWMGVRLLVQMEIAVVQFLREQTEKGFQGHVLLRALSNVYLHEIQYACNLTINDWTYGWQYTTPAFRVTFGGFAFLMNADFDIRFNLTLWPSFCGPDGSMGIRFRPITIVEADAYAELENDFFGLGSLATLYLNYYLDTQMAVPSGCFYLYHAVASSIKATIPGVNVAADDKEKLPVHFIRLVPAKYIPRT